jgi:hypothetical protein
MRYLSQEWKSAEWADFEEMMIGGDESDCGGQTFDPPCGGCARCLRMQFGYYMMKEEEAARVLLRAGFAVTDPRLVTVDYPYRGLAIHAHNASNCRDAGEREDWPFPWEKKSW